MNQTQHSNNSKEFEDKDNVGLDSAVDEVSGRAVPEEIAALSEAEYNLVVKAIVRKADCVIMWV